MSPRYFVVYASLSAMLCVGCRPARVESYRIPKEKDPEFPVANAAANTPAAGSAATSGDGMAGTPVRTAEGVALVWSAPTDWTPKPSRPSWTFSPR